MNVEIAVGFTDGTWMSIFTDVDISPDQLGNEGALYDQVDMKQFAKPVAFLNVIWHGTEEGE